MQQVNKKYKGSLVTVKTDDGEFSGIFDFVDETGVMIEVNRRPVFFSWDQVFHVKKAN